MPNNNQGWDQINSAISQFGGGILGMGLGAINRDQQMRDQRELMQQQYQNQLGLNLQGHELQKAMWDYTNYENQAEHMKKAGLNIGLMYGQGGGGGTTAGSQGGGSASMGQVNNKGIEAMGMGLQFAQAQANMELTKAQTRNLNVEADVKEGKNELGALNIANLKADTGNVEQDTTLKKVQQTGLEIQNYINDNTKELTIENAETLSKQLDEQLETLQRDNYKGNATLKTDIAQAKADLATTYLQQQATRAGIALTKEQTRAIGEELAQGWEKLSLTHDSNKLQMNDILLRKYLGEKNLELIYRGQNIEIGKAVTNIMFGGPKMKQENISKYDKQGNYQGEIVKTSSYK